ncbi:LytR C-terminal domain-containing protein [Agrococcus sp. ARC_14]|uniref:LytR C-terminal domain-containing protein n=1 Tax=Agrococcus sp. ARC_14 TaxID=2919927 RepID=UPI001F065D09|nr:LytR C-terminal domain-containing protein [Agrococcus sp. ARC_14]MCH1884361.1 LytR C-terminal domain-containing protein [Agrococcus sp. ARC_14]
MSRPQRVGAHRSTATSRWPRWAILLAGLAVAIVLAAIGLFALDLLRPRAPEPVATEQAEIVTDPSAIDPALDASVTVLDASGETGLAAGVGQALSDSGWDVVATGGSSEASETTVVWFDSEELAPVARGLAAALGVGDVQLSDGRLSGTPITIVVGPDAVGTAPSQEPRDDGELEHAPGTEAP